MTAISVPESGRVNLALAMCYKHADENLTGAAIRILLPTLPMALFEISIAWITAVAVIITVYRRRVFRSWGCARVGKNCSHTQANDRTGRSANRATGGRVTNGIKQTNACPWEHFATKS